MKRKIRLTESDLTRLIKRVISEQNTTKDVTVKVDCTKKTVDGFTGIADGFFTKHCATAQAGTTTQAGAGTVPQSYKGTELQFYITDDEFKNAVGLGIGNFSVSTNTAGRINGPGQSMFTCWNEYTEFIYKWDYQDPAYNETIWKVPAKKQALTNLFKKQCQSQLKWAKANGKVGGK